MVNSRLLARLDLEVVIRRGFKEEEEDGAEVEIGDALYTEVRVVDIDDFLFLTALCPLESYLQQKSLCGMFVAELPGHWIEVQSLTLHGQ